MVDTKTIKWMDRDSGVLNRIIDFSHFHGEDLVWYEDAGTLERHCMSVDMFVTKHKACGVFYEYETN